MDKPPSRQQSVEREETISLGKTNGHSNGHARGGSPVDSPRDVFPEDDLPRPRSRGSVARESFRIELTPEDLRHQKEQKLRKQKHLFIGLLIFFSTILVLGCVSSVHWYIQNEAHWHITISQLAGVFGIFIIAIIVNIVCLFKVYKKERKQRIDWTDPEVNDY